MEYTKIRMDFDYPEKDRFYRIVLVKGDPDLLRLGVMLGEALGAQFTHDFHFRANFKNYQEAWAMENAFEGDCYLGRHVLSDLPDTFRYCYDIGDGWTFRCKRYKRKAEREEDEPIILLEGKGQGIWEDNIAVLLSYLDGEIDKDCSEEDDEEGIYKPWNYKIKTFGEFDLPLDIEKINEDIKINYPLDYDGVKSSEEDYIKEHNPCLDDKEEDPKQKRFFPSSVYGEVDMILIMNPKVEKVFKELESLYGWGRSRNMFAAIYLKDAFVLDMMDQEFDKEAYLKELKALVKEAKSRKKADA